MKNIALIASAFFLAVAVFTGHVFAQAKGHLELKTVALQQVEAFNEEGKKETKLVPAGKVVPGDEVLYRIEYRNVSDEIAENVHITNPVPEHMVYKTGTAEGADTAISFSADGGKTYETAGKVTVTGTDGKPRIADPAEYTHIRWDLEKPIAPGASGKVQFTAELQ